MDSVDSLETWAAYELWTLREAAYLMSGLPPRSEVEFKADLHGEGPVAKAYRALKDATVAESLAFKEFGGLVMRCRVRPSDVVAWAVKRGMLVPAALMSARVDMTEPAPGVTAEQPDPQRRLAELRAGGGSVKWWRGRWAITGIDKLTAAEKASGRKRCDQKTIRKDLKEAAETERREGAKSASPSPFPT